MTQLDWTLSATLETIMLGKRLKSKFARLNPSVKIDILTPTIHDFRPPRLDPSLDPIVCHWRTSALTPLAYARRDLLAASDTEWSLFIDDDVQWDSESILRLVSSRLDDDIGAVETQIFDDPQGSNSEMVRKGPHFESKRVTRGWTGFTLVRSSQCRDWSPPPINTFEDESLRRFLAKKGLKWVRDLDITITHKTRYHTPVQFFEDGVNASRVLSRKSVFWNLAKYPLFLRHGRKRTASYTFFLKGILSGLTHKPKRPTSLADADSST